MVTQDGEHGHRPRHRARPRFFVFCWQSSIPRLVAVEVSVEGSDQMSEVTWRSTPLGRWPSRQGDGKA